MAKYDSITKRERNRRILLFKEAHPELSLKEIGEVFRITGVRVWQILKRGNDNARGHGNVSETR